MIPLLVTIWSHLALDMSGHPESFQISGLLLMVTFEDLPEPAHLVVCASLLIC